MRPRAPGIAAAVLLASACGKEDPVGPASNRAPVIQGIAVTPKVIPNGGTAVVVVTAADPDGDALFYSFEARVGTVTPEGPQSNRATYAAGAARGSDEIRVTVRDSKNAAATGVETVTLQDNRAPLLQMETLVSERACHPPCSLTIVANASDADDGDRLSYLWSGCASGGEATSRCTVGSPGPHTAAVLVMDGRGGVATGAVTVEGRNGAPAVAGGRSFSGPGVHRFNITNNDPDNDQMTCGWLGTCECRGDTQSLNVNCTLPAELGRCAMTFACADTWGATGATSFEILR
jgi:hypothetical protein